MVALDLSSADYVIVGGGTAGLVVACRLSEDPTTQVIILESGQDHSNDPQVQNHQAWSTLTGSELDWRLETTPQPGFNNRKIEYPLGKIVGGSSAINGSAFLPPSPAGINTWAKLGNPNWTWESLAPYIKKSYTLHPPDDQHRPHSLPTGPIQVTYPALVDHQDKTLVRAWNDAFADQGYEYISDLLAEKQTVGTRPYTAAIDPVSGHRSSADSQYGSILRGRANVTIVTGATVRRIVFDSADQTATATGVEVQWSEQIREIKARKEIILAAGAIHTPKILELSGIGDEARLRDLQIPLVINNPSVGENLQNHVMSVLPVPMKPHSEIQDITPGIKALSFVRLDSDLQTLLDPAQPTSSILQSPSEASACLFLTTLPGNIALLGVLPGYPSSRGNTHIHSSDPDATPAIDPRFLENEVDLQILVRHVQQAQKMTATAALEPFLHALPESDSATLAKELRESMALPTYHSCGTAAMLPREAGGVVGQDLKVYGTENVRVVDASVFPVISHANPMATVYAVAERASDIIKS